MSSLDRVHFALLRLYPRSFREEYGRELQTVFALRRRDAVGPLATLGLIAGTFVDVLASAAAVHADILGQDLRYTFRTLRRAPGFALTAIAVTALGVGANTAAFSVADFVLIRPLPFPDPQRLVKIWATTTGYRNEASPAVHRDWKGLSRSFASMGAYANRSVNLVGQGEPARLESAEMTADLLPLLGARPLMGRVFTPAEARAGAGGTVVLGYGVWQAQLGGDPAVIGRSVSLDGAPHVVIGVMPRDFHFPTRAVQLWTPLQLSEESYSERDNNYLYVVARLKDGVTLEQARAEMDVIAARLERQHPSGDERSGALVVRLRDDLPAQPRLLLLALSGAALCVLLIACANLGNLLLARGLLRRHELSVRSTLGAGRDRLVRQLVTESLVLAALGGACGVLLALAAVPLLSRLVPDALPIAQAPTIDPRVLLFAALVTALTGIGFGVFPALRASREGDLEGLGSGARVGGGGRQRLRSALVVAEVTATVVLLVSAGLLMRALLRIAHVDPGFRPDGVLTLRTALPWPRYQSTLVRERFLSRVLAEVRSLPGVTAAGYVSGLPMVMTGGIWGVDVEGEAPRPDVSRKVSLRFATPGLFAALGIPLLAGRELADSDRAGRPEVAVVSESFARQHWPGQDPLGRRFKIAASTRTVAGVAGDVRVRGPERTSEPQVYLPYNQQPEAGLIGYTPKDLVVRGGGEPTSLVPAIRRIVHEADPEQPISDVRPMTEVVGEQTSSRSVQVRVIGAFAAVAFLLAGVGLHGLLSYAVSSRRQEIGVRLALGAEPRDIARMVTRHGTRLAMAGLIPGAAIAYAAGRGMQSLLAGVEPADGVTFLAAIGLCAVMTMLGSLVPVLRAVRVPPTVLIRAE